MAFLSCDIISRLGAEDSIYMQRYLSFLSFSGAIANLTLSSISIISKWISSCCCSSFFLVWWTKSSFLYSWNQIIQVEKVAWITTMIIIIRYEIGSPVVLNPFPIFSDNHFSIVVKNSCKPPNLLEYNAVRHVSWRKSSSSKYRAT